MTQEERKRFDVLQRQLNESPANRISFFASVEGIEQPNPVNNPYERWQQQTEFENRAICKYLNIKYKASEFQISDADLAREWVQNLPDISL